MLDCRLRPHLALVHIDAKLRLDRRQQLDAAERVEFEVVPERSHVRDFGDVSFAYLADDVQQAPCPASRADARGSCGRTRLLNPAEKRIDHYLFLYLERVGAWEILVRPDGESSDPLLFRQTAIGP